MIAAIQHFVNRRRKRKRETDLDELFHRVRRIELVLAFLAGAQGFEILKVLI